MTITIGRNILSLKAIRQLDKSSGELTSVYERLSSDMRINRASDDAAGLAVATGLNAAARIYIVKNSHFSILPLLWFKERCALIHDTSSNNTTYFY